MGFHFKALPCGHCSSFEKLSLILSNVLYFIAAIKIKDTLGKYLLFSIFIISSVYHTYGCCIDEQDDIVLKLQALDWVVASSVMFYFLVNSKLNKELLILIIPTLTVHGVTFFIEHKYYPVLHTLWHIGGGLVALKIIEQNSRKKIQI
tara:strand:+ start:2604 stop:3047 length:444 start_codon:yes stop_codon:yes gene_type:complete